MRLLLLVVLLPLDLQAAVGIVAEHVTVHSDPIRASDVVRLQNADAELLSQLAMAELGPAPRPGESLVLPRGTLLTRLRSSLPAAVRVEWRLPERIVIARASSQVALADIQRALLAYVEANQSVPIEDLSIEGLSVQTPILVPEGVVSLEFERPDGDDLLGPTSLTLLVRVDGVEVDRRPVRARIDGQTRALVTTRALRPGQEISDLDLSEELRPLARIPRQPVFDRREVVGRLARRAIGTNQILALSDVEEKPLLRRRDPVVLIIRTRSLLVTCPGEALEDGREGDVISVLNAQTRQPLRGRVSRGGEVEVEYRPPSEVLQRITGRR